MKDLANQATTAQDANLLDVEALQAEVHKWQERVPKLATALRERSEELEQVKTQLRELQKDEAGDTRLQARDQLIEELEEKLAAASAQQRELAGQLHATKLETQALDAEKLSWKEKWQSLTSTLDACVVEKDELVEKLSAAETRWQDNESSLLQQTQDMQNEFLQEIAQLNEHIEAVECDAKDFHQTQQRLEQECASLGQRNKTLQDSAELANNQMASMGEELQQLNAQITDLNQAVASAESRHQQAETANEDLQRTNQQLQQNNHELCTANDALQANCSQLQTMSDQLQQQLDGTQRTFDDLRTCWAREVDDLQQLTQQQNQQVDQLQQELVDVVSRLSEQATLAQRERDEAVKHAQQLELQTNENQAAAQTAKAELERVRQQLTERSNLVRDLEAEMQAQQDAQTREVAELRTAADRLPQVESQLMEANNKADTQHQHAQQLEHRLHQQMELLNQLEDELSQAQRQTTDAQRVAEEKQRSLEQQLMDVSEHREELQAEIENLRSTPAASQKISAEDSRHEVLSLQKLLTERTQELEDLRWRVEQTNSSGDPNHDGGNNPAENVVMVLNQQLKDARDENERLLAQLAQANGDDLTQIKGVGSKLAKQLSELGYGTYAQIAQLTNAMLEEEDHPLHSMRSRAYRDLWIEQARELLES